MKVLFLHPKDRANEGPWQKIRWDWIVDLGWSGHWANADLAGSLRCRVFSVRHILDHKQHLACLREQFRPGSGKLIDKEGVDWWDTFFPLPYGRIEEILLASTLAGQIPRRAEKAPTRPHFMIRALSALLRREIKTFPDRHETLFARYFKAGSNLRPFQFVEI